MSSPHNNRMQRFAVLILQSRRSPRTAVGRYRWLAITAILFFEELQSEALVFAGGAI
jgi:hypothetical protein